MHRSDAHTFSKFACPRIDLLEGLGVDGDAHAGKLVRHRSRVKADPNQPNLRQVHLLATELFDWLAASGFTVNPGDLGENITTTGIDLVELPRGTRLHIGAAAVIEITGLRNPCTQLDAFQDGLMDALLERSDSGQLIRKAGVMGIVHTGGAVMPGNRIRVELPAQPHVPLERV